MACCMGLPGILLVGCSDGYDSAPAEIRGDESLMNQKDHGTCPKGLMSPLRWNVDSGLADNICCFNRHYAERAGYFPRTEFPVSKPAEGEITFYDSVCGLPLFVAPRGRSWEAFLRESRAHGWPSFRDEEVVTENVRVLRDGETVSITGTHLGHNLPDGRNRYCINLVAVAGPPNTAVPPECDLA
eukprot:CAMPEP_0168480202 /NCGR_PEP_ID=MMETSP0228-20121227/63870_1 /TAXON_ID=133427 /ORGANISM="Protoceratium reticulatum, Strain CCCM 535 (=CCMP 1889)" /LENGTH=184 /DNA_ID=CAMNT_0008496523 /DNA_START=5 /DNA_END=559 /DNA_ORIENTATION=-